MSGDVQCVSEMFKVFENLKCLSYLECLRMSGVSEMSGLSKCLEELAKSKTFKMSDTLTV